MLQLSVAFPPAFWKSSHSVKALGTPSPQLTVIVSGATNTGISSSFTTTKKEWVVLFALFPSLIVIWTSVVPTGNVLPEE